ncbi:MULTISPECIES: ethanolamine ammonia-lyase subunit EutC [unclassified Caulobacter]|uniref:ethanolamine ammonia-lyase subunit EutC n=1 Tax=unclassified Caulobacter TaxID=2648921 RepID=UPI000D3B8434|nr:MULTISPECIES: ethanolamine ammonia-lyase subunit EutC [unclassified Caulobacter]PTS87242.1 ethanolamine ammonia-lyase [Caulobacter sp. HMWF009]PTT12464.1 ethanolamine ammonia-lyase [Caulobacter sp. HMWF025]PTT75587.1 ethanolamine ammonia-lyase [Pseudomonas sp. HMWF010]
MNRPPSNVPPDPWSALRAHTPARIALGRSGASLPTQEVLAFALAHAQARDAVHTSFEAQAVGEAIASLGLETLQVASAAPDRATYLRRPDLGRRLLETSRDALKLQTRGPADLVIVVADGLSSTAVHTHAAPLIAALLPQVHQQGWCLGPVVIARQARVALGDEVGEIFGARLVLLLVGERPGLSSPDSLGAYLTFAPRVGLTDEARNCVSNIRTEGLSYEQAAFKLVWLAREALRLGESGVALKDESDTAQLAPPRPALSPQP